MGGIARGNYEGGGKSGSGEGGDPGGPKEIERHEHELGAHEVDSRRQQQGCRLLVGFEVCCAKCFFQLSVAAESEQKDGNGRQDDDDQYDKSDGRQGVSALDENRRGYQLCR